MAAALLRNSPRAGGVRAAGSGCQIHPRHELADRAGLYAGPGLNRRRVELFRSAMPVAARDAAAVLDAARLERRAESGSGEGDAGQAVVAERLLHEDVVVDAHDVRVRFALFAWA